MAMTMSLAVISLLSTVSLAARITITDQNSKATNVKTAGSPLRSVFLTENDGGYGPSGFTVKLQCWDPFGFEQATVTDAKGGAHFDNVPEECERFKVIVMDGSQKVKTVDYVTFPCEMMMGGVCYGGPQPFEIQLDKTCSEAGADPWMEGLGGCCPELTLCKEARPIDNAAYCDVSNPRHGKTCWSEVEMCREHCTAAAQATGVKTAGKTVTRDVYLRDSEGPYGAEGVLVGLQCVGYGQQAISDAKGGAHFEHVPKDCQSFKVVVIKGAGETVKTLEDVTFPCDMMIEGVCYGGIAPLEVRL